MYCTSRPLTLHLSLERWTLTHMPSKLAHSKSSYHAPPGTVSRRALVGCMALGNHHPASRPLTLLRVCTSGQPVPTSPEVPLSGHHAPTHTLAAAYDSALCSSKTPSSPIVLGSACLGSFRPIMTPCGPPFVPCLSKRLRVLGTRGPGGSGGLARQLAASSPQ